MDVIIYVDEFANNDQEKKINNIEIFSGGSAANIASGLGRLGKQIFIRNCIAVHTVIENADGLPVHLCYDE